MVVWSNWRYNRIISGIYSLGFMEFSIMSSFKNIGITIEILKALRSGWISTAMLGMEVGISKRAAYRWIEALRKVLPVRSIESHPRRYYLPKDFLDGRFMTTKVVLKIKKEGR